MYKKFLWTIALVFSLISTGIVFANPSMCRVGLNKMVQSLNLSSAQKEKIKPILAHLKSNLRATGSQIGSVDSQITRQVNSANMNQRKINSLVDTKAKLIGNMMKAKIMAKSQILSILNPQQRAKLQSMTTKADAKMAAAFKNCGND